MEVRQERELVWTTLPMECVLWETVILVGDALFARLVFNEMDTRMEVRLLHS
jgi:hypothetical protein